MKAHIYGDQVYSIPLSDEVEITGSTKKNSIKKKHIAITITLVLVATILFFIWGEKQIERQREKHQEQ